MGTVHVPKIALRRRCAVNPLHLSSHKEASRRVHSTHKYFGGIWEGVEFHIWIHMEHNGRGPRGGRCPEAKEIMRVGESEPFGKLPVFGGRLWASQRVGIYGTKPTFSSSQRTGRPQMSFWSHRVNKICFVGCSEE